MTIIAEPTESAKQSPGQVVHAVPATVRSVPTITAPLDQLLAEGHGLDCSYCKQPAPNKHTAATGATYWLCDSCDKATELGRTTYTAHFEQVTFGPGVRMGYKRVDDTTLRVGYDPAEMDALDARLALGIFATFTEGEKVDKLVEVARGAETDAIRGIFTILLDQIDKHGDTNGTLAAAEKVFTRVVNRDHDATQARCPRHTWCVETGAHVEHTGDSVEPLFLEEDRRELLAAGLTHWSKGIKVGFLEQDLTPAEARIKVAELRAHLDAVEKLIDTAEEAQ
ncbi:hypothetical protein ACFXGT_28340 [Streptomyces sp. NPDC059352]|uniref:hypothetical protein n=1 Tax=Streptomyces sp. NPDC059352 TaxID=3346810 RepID=UPI00369C73BC